jgi:hypothetical protein
MIPKRFLARRSISTARDSRLTASIVARPPRASTQASFSFTAALSRLSRVDRRGATTSDISRARSRANVSSARARGRVERRRDVMIRCDLK